MNIMKIGNYTIIKGQNFKQVYSPTRMLQLNKNKVFYVDLCKNKILKIGKIFTEWRKNEQL